ncbi:hypothetical protein CAPI_07685 [Corynebacterium capitovis DSM 44611]|uniref:DUF6928 family protein n=1 Tax=Corynebacterium capitovis TaxID=131081 RepID=UPI000366B838|nr:hypothetical protein [Corynebacterium capitovis]WKD58073.1 hypothetical protein CAPI_07685 [Corynebacterium capitovis DSM 44611]
MSNPAVVTLWFVNTADPAQVLEGEPKADRGFGRKLLAQLNPAWPITPIGEFPLNRSSLPSRNEFYIAGYPGVAVVQTFVDDAGALSTVAPELRQGLPAADVYLFAEGTESDFAGFAHFAGPTLQRALTATRDVVIEDVGLPDPFEAPYWAGEKAEQIGGISLPFEPKDLARAAQETWIGVDVSPSGPDINVVGYAIDGRPEPRIEKPAQREETKSVEHVAARFAQRERDADYDDYEGSPDATGEQDGEEFAQLVDASVAAAKRVTRIVRRRVRAARSALIERIRHSDR